MDVEDGKSALFAAVSLGAILKLISLSIPALLGYQTLYAKVGSDLDCPSRSKSTSPRVEYSCVSADAKGLVEGTTTMNCLFENRRSKSVPAGCCRSDSKDLDGAMWFESESVDYSCMEELKEVEQASEGASSAVIEYLTRGIMSEPCREDYSINHGRVLLLIAMLYKTDDQSYRCHPLGTVSRNETTLSRGARF